MNPDVCDGDEQIFWTLDTIPVEVFLHICTFLEGKDIIKSLKCTCVHFYEILSEESIWRQWLKRRWPKLPPSSISSNICYKDNDIPIEAVSIKVDRGLKLWSVSEDSFTKIVHNTHLSTVDTVTLVQGGMLGLSGSRDRSIGVWNTDRKLELVDQKQNAHNGWIWSFALCPDTNGLFSCSWDSTVKQWSLDQQLTEVYLYRCSAAALSLASRQHITAVGLFSPRVELFDHRDGSLTPFTTYTSHTRSIMALCFIRNFVISASEDQTLSIWDLTAGKAFKSGIQCGEGYPLTLSFTEGNLLLVGDSKGKLHMFDTNNNSFKLIESFDMGHAPRGSITSMWHNTGMILTGSKDETVRIHSTTRPPHFINRLKSSNGGVTSLDYVDPVLLLGCANSNVELWMPSRYTT